MALKLAPLVGRVYVVISPYSQEENHGDKFVGDD